MNPKLWLVLALPGGGALLVGLWLIRRWRDWQGGEGTYRQQLQQWDATTELVIPRLALPGIRPLKAAKIDRIARFRQRLRGR